MKRLPAILFAFILLFNFCGYNLMLDCLQEKGEEAFAARVDHQAFNESELISIKIPTDIPYYTNSSDYERAYGSVKVNGVDYEYVKRRVYHDTLEVLCLPNQAKTAIQQTRNEFAKSLLDGNTSSPSKKSGHTAKISLPDFCQELKPSDTYPPVTYAKQNSSYSINFSSSDHTLRQERPPQA